MKRYESANVEDIHKLISENFTKGSKILELGCGSGRDAAYAFSTGLDIYGVDGATNMVESAIKVHPELKQRLSVALIPQDLEDTPSTYDGIFATALLMHLEIGNIKETFERVFTILKEKGRFIFSVPLSHNELDNNRKDAKGRLFILLPKEDWFKFADDKGFKLIQYNITADGLDRSQVTWLTCVVEK